MNIQPLTSFSSEIITLLALAIGNPTPEKIQSTISSYNAASHHLIGCFIQNKVVGIIGFEIKGPRVALIKHLAVLGNYRGQGIARALVNEVIKRYALTYIEAETDSDAVEFYKKCNFTCTKINHSGIERFRCILRGKNE